MFDNIPPWLNAPPTQDFPDPPVDTRAQTLPYSALKWENFERLVLRLVRQESTVSDCFIYGKQGSKQHGIDILALSNQVSEKVICYQCKDVKSFGARAIEKVVDEFLVGKWAKKANCLVLCISLKLDTTGQIDAIEQQKKRLDVEGIDFQIWDGSEGGQLSEKLKRYPELVDDFFLRAWVERFNGEKAASALEDRLDGKLLSELWGQLRVIYETLFLRHDPGIRLGSQASVALLERYVLPDVLERNEILASDVGYREEQSDYSGANETETLNLIPEDQRGHTTPSVQVSSIEELHFPVSEWFKRQERSVILGEPGSGKSTLLRAITLQLMNSSDEAVVPWHSALPIWVSFGGFSAALESNPGMSFEDYFDQWLHKHGADGVRALFSRAAKSNDILLLIDGLDENKNVNGAHQALDRITTFLSIRKIPAIFTSRPKGYEILRPDGSWPTCSLVSFNDVQIEKFSNVWFGALEPVEASSQEKEGVDIKITSRSTQFLSTIKANPHILELARTPLFCQLLIDIFRHSHQLPEKRIDVYERVVELLLTEHPASRIQAAGLADYQNATNISDLREMLVRLSLRIQMDSISGLISSDECQELFCEFLIDDINGPGLSRYEAKKQAEILLEHAKSGLGLMVERAPEELGFFHLSIQEYLAARAMLRKDKKEQEDWLTQNWSKSNWHEVIISWFSIMSAEQGREKAFSALEFLKKHGTNPWDKLQLTILSVELAIIDTVLPTREARNIINHAANQLETTPFIGFRVKLAKYIALGLRSHAIVETCKSRIKNWLPGYSDWDRSKLLDGFARWKPAEDLLGLLIKGIFDENFAYRKTVAECLAKLYSGNIDVEKTLFEIASESHDIDARSAALYSLWRGWHDSSPLLELANKFRTSIDTNLALTSIAIRVSNGVKSESDLEIIWDILVNKRWRFELNDFLITTLLQGWKDDDEFKARLLRGLGRGHNNFRTDDETIFLFLAKAWPGDGEVADALATWFRQYSSWHLHNSSLKRELLNNFSGSDKLTPIIRENLAESKLKYKSIFWGPDANWGYCMIGDQAAKEEVISGYLTESDERHKQWIVSTLMEGWGEDPDVKELIAKEFLKPPHEIPFLATWVNMFITDPEERRKWLLEALSSSDKYSHVTPAHLLLEEFNDRECVEVIRAKIKDDIWYYAKVNLQNLFIEKYPDDPDVLEWVDSAFINIDECSLSSIAVGNENTMGVRNRLFKAAQSVKTDIRREIYKAFHEHSIPSAIVLNLTEEIWAESQSELRTRGVIARSKATLNLGGPEENFIKKLNEELNCAGTDNQIRRRAAFFGLIELGKYESCIQALTRPNLSISRCLVDYHKSDSFTVRMLVDNFEIFEDAIAESAEKIDYPWEEMIFNGTARKAITNDKARVQIEHHLRTLDKINMSPASVSLFSELAPSSSELQQYLVAIMEGEAVSRRDFSVFSEAQRIYAEQFNSDESALEKIDIERFPDRYLYLLAIGWPDHPIVQKFIDELKESERYQIHILLVISTITSDEELAGRCIDSIIEHTKNVGHSISVVITNSLLKWAASPVADTLLSKFIDDPDASRMITAIKLLSLMGKLKTHHRSKLVMKFNDLFESPESDGMDGIDIISGKSLTISQAIYGALN